MRLTLLIPELLWSEPGDSEANAPAAASALAKILAQRHFARHPNAGWEATLLRLTGLHTDSSLAVLRALGDGLAITPAESAESAGHWLCADPVHLRFHQNRLILADAQELALETAELDALAARLNAALAGRAECFFSGPSRGYLRLLKPPAPAGDTSGHAGQAISRKIGCEVRPADFGDDAELRGLANEIQMLLHADPLNQQREARGKPVLNALWLWGAGTTPRRAESPHTEAIDAITGQHPLIAGIARTLGIPHGDATPRVAPPARHVLHFIDALSPPTHYQDSAGYAKAWQTLDRQHLAPALGALRGWRLRQVDIVAPVVFGELHWQLTPLAAWLGGFSRLRWPDLVSRLATPLEQEGKIPR